MKKITAIILTVIILISSVSVLCFAKKEQEVFVVLGDSIAEGVGAFPRTSSYSYTVAKDRDYDLYNCALSGKQSWQLLDDVMEDDYTRSRIEYADIIEISIGGNDFLQHNIVDLAWKCLWGDFATANKIVEDFSENYEEIIDEIRYLNPDACIIAQTLYNPIWWMPAMGNAYEKVLAKLNAVYYTYEQTDSNYYVVDIHGAFDNRIGLVFIDMTHPSPFGHNVIAKKLEAKLDEIGM